MILSPANLKKAYYYLQRNGIANTWYAARERIQEKKQTPYTFIPASEDRLQVQRSEMNFELKSGASYPLISILVPTFRTKPVFLQELLDCMLAQTYSVWELVFADASGDDSVKNVVTAYMREKWGEPAGASDMDKGLLYRKDFSSVRYLPLEKNAGISENTNAALKIATGDYIGLLDHDDLLTPDALYEMLQEMRKVGAEIAYSDEDKCDGAAAVFFDPNIKPDFNLDYLLSNNYICHFLMMETNLARRIGFRKEYDGAQDYDFILRGALYTTKPIAHVAKVLYHWRCHSASTAENPKSKEYAYKAGKQAAQDYISSRGWKAGVYSLRHVGFYGVEYNEDPMECRPDLGAVGGRILSRSKNGITLGGPMDRDGNALYGGLPAPYSGPMHRACLQQQVPALDIRCIRVSPALRSLFEQVVGVHYTEKRLEALRDLSEGGSKNSVEAEREYTCIFDYTTLPEKTDFIALSVKLSKAIEEAGYQLLYLPAWETIWKK